MSWKNLPSWLKGGMIISSISFIILIIYYLYFDFMMIFGEIIFYVLYPIITLTIMSVEMCGQECPSEVISRFLIVISALINIGVHFLIGVFIGWLYSKIKSNNNID